MNSEFSTADYWSAGFDDDGLRAWAERLRAQLGAHPVSLGLVFMSPKFFPHAQATLEILRVHARIPLLAGCSSASLVAGSHEFEDATGIVLALYSLPGADLKGFRFTQQQVEAADGQNYWPLESGVEAKRSNGWLAFIDPFHLDAESWVRSWNTAYAPMPTFGGLSSGIFSEQSTQVYLNGEVFEDGGVAVSFGGDVKLSGVISQGCTPIGETWTLTRVEQNLIHQIANRPAYAVLAETVQKLSPADQQKARGNLFIGLVVNEYLEDFHRGDFLVRNLIGGDPNSGVLAVAALPRAGQTMQFHRRDAVAANEDMDELLAHAKEKIGGATIYGGCLCCCNGRGKNLFSQPDHDAELVQKEFGPIGLAGFYGNGEIGPVGGKNYLHGFTASLALFVKK
ncbi:MAG TPA: FIST N-terminal domain-containing protein [Candidatus Paceibacterota bacterium]|nr:FIST N-terminal domain-containing protein [Candidatus Paceibacterota bacterium]